MTTPTNKRVPPDADILASLRAGRTLAEIAARYDVRLSTLRHHVSRNRLFERAREDAAPQATLRETSQKIVCKRNAVLPGRRFGVIEVLISLPRIPTLHGHFVAAMPSAQGV